MALLSTDKTKLAKVENIVVGKNLIQFMLRIYQRVDQPAIVDETVVAPYDINGANPYVQAYDWLINNRQELQDWVNDTLPELQKATKKKVK